MKDKKPTITATLISVLIPLNIITMPVVAYAILSYLSKETDAGILLIFLWPVALVGLAVLLADGTLAIKQAIRPDRPLSKPVRVFIGIAGVIPTAFVLWLIAWFALVQISTPIVAQRAKTPLSLQQAKQMVDTCKVRSITRGSDSQVSIYLEPRVYDIYENFASMNNGYRRIDPAAFNELLTDIHSPHIRDTCGYIYVTDYRYDAFTSDISWITLDELKTKIEACTVDEVHTGTLPHEFSVPTGPSGTLAYRIVHEPGGLYSHAYLETVYSRDREALYDFARSKQASCPHHQPNVVMP